MRSVLAAGIVLWCGVAAADDSQFNGRWDISVKGDSPRNRAWWLEVNGAGTDNLKGRFVGAPGGDVEDIPKLSIFDGELRFVFENKNHREGKSAQTPKGLYWARFDDGKLKGTFEIEGDPSTYLDWTGVRAPALPDKDDGTWKRGDPVALFNGRDLSGWQPPVNGHASGWSARDGVLTNTAAASDLVSEKKFGNFDLHVEYRISQRGNSGLGLRGRYELQILDDYGDPPSKHGNAAIYGRIPPKVNASKPAGEWQVYEIRLLGRQVSVTLNGLRVIDKAVVEGLTAIALDANESEPGPITIQGDHGTVEFRKIILYPLVKAH